jgi:outer membrane protein OmpA-like peptidoglycan-associated protein
LIDYSQLYLIWPPIAILLIGLVAGWFLQRYVLVKQMEELETQHLDLLRSAEDEMHAARDEARLQGQKLDEAQMAITLGYERLTLLDRRLKDAEDRLIAPPPLLADPNASEAMAARLSELERALAAAKAATVMEPSSALKERDATIASLRNEVADIEALRLRLSEMVSELGLAHSQVVQLTRERDEAASRAAAAASESSNELLRKLADAIARREELEVALGEAQRRIATAETERDRAIATGMAKPVAAPRAMAAAASAGFGFVAEPVSFPAPRPTSRVEPSLEIDDEDHPPPAIPLLSPAQLTGGLSQLLFENRILFAPDRSDILPDSKLLLEDIADLILSSEPVRMVIEGHTERGDARASFYLSERRAVAVMERLVKLGVPETRMMTVGYGDTRPIDENSSHEGRMRNRRVEIRVLGRL